MKVLILLSVSEFRTVFSDVLISNRFVVQTTDSVKECLQFARSEQYEGILVDSDSVGFEDVVSLVGLLREQNVRATVFVLARFLDLEQRLRLFNAGVDDCSSGEVFASELAARFRIVIRLREAASPSGLNRVGVLRSGDLELDLVRRSAKWLGEAVDLRSKEFLLLEYLVRNANRPVTRTMILEHVWNSSFEGLTNVVDVHISALRRKFERRSSQQIIKTNHGIGYTFTSGGKI
jgi:DNA-binding response OmpR family regulator